MPRAFVNLTTTAAENTLANDMDTAILALANELAGNNPANIQITSQDRDGLGTTYHEAGTLWMGTSAQTSVTDTNGRFHNVANAFCADQALFVTVGSVNPTLTGLVLSRKVARHRRPRSPWDDEKYPRKSAGQMPRLAGCLRLPYLSIGHKAVVWLFNMFGVK